MGLVNSAQMHYSQLTCQQLQAEPKRERERERERERTRETQNAAVDVESQHIQNTTRLILIGFSRNEEMFSIY